MALTVLLVHDYYRSASPSGENRCFEDERDLLARAGHHVVTYTRANDEIVARSFAERLRLGVETVWSRRTLRDLRALLRRRLPDVAHFQNTFPLISPSAYAACREAGVPVVQSVHNFRVVCPNAQLFRDGGPCEDCVGRPVAWLGVARRCYRGGLAPSGTVAAMLAVHRARSTWTRDVDLFIAPSAFAAAKLVEGGLPAERVAVKPNFVHPDPGPGRHGGGFALFVGRLGEEKGVRALLAACERLRGTLPMVVAGDGPLAPLVARAAERGVVRWTGALGREEVARLMGEATLAVVQSISYETFGRVVVEAFARATPVVATRIGALAELVDDGRTGLVVDPGDPDDLARALTWAARNPAELRRMGAEARRDFETKYTADRNLAMLLDLYRRARSLAGRGTQRSRVRGPAPIARPEAVRAGSVGIGKR
ncbi:MAG: glycosyltransferase family 4 protein [Acidobacteria bacterium]|nr:glycosyltransferase family 4 protein [Acidobacteriota bacterium]